MSTPTPPQSSPPTYSIRAGVLSYLVPGLGQISQGRIGKGLLFLVCLYGLFFYGMYLGDWKNVYVPDVTKHDKLRPEANLIVNIYNRLQFAGQFWIGIAAWPALWQYNQLPVPSAEGSPFWHNFDRSPPERKEDAPRDWEGKSLNELQSEGDKTWDLGWIYTVIAGVLNVLVIYDAAAGPALGTAAARPQPAPEEAAAA
jgi:hypothetical protein